jgi:hypothetical protein
VQHIESVWIEHEEEPDSSQPDRDFFNVVVTLRDGSRYALNVWSMSYVRERCEQSPPFILPPDLIVSSPDRLELLRVLTAIVEEDALPAHCKLRAA